MQIEIKKLPAVPRLAQDYQSGYAKVKKFFAGDYTKWSEFERKAKEVAASERPDLSSFHEILREQNRNFNAGERSFENIALLEKPDAFVVVTGQQVGLFTGPLYTVYKALTTIKLAEVLSEKLARPVVPVFYIVSEDHDFAEVQWVGLLDKKNDFIKIEYDHPQGAGRRPVAEIILDDHIQDILNQVEKVLPVTEFSRQLLETLKQCYQPGVAFHIAFCRLFQTLFKNYGIIIFDSSDSRIKKFVKAVFERELKEQVTCSAMAATNEELVAQGYHIQIAVIANRPGVFVLRNGRHSLEGDGRLYVNKNSQEKIAVDELLSDPTILSPKATLRPIVEDTLFPTIAYVGGPGEISYWAQLKGVYERFGLPMPIVVPRAGFTLVEPKVSRLLKKHDIQPNDFLLDSDAFLTNLKKSLMPDELAEKFMKLKLIVSEKLEALEPLINSIDPTLQNVQVKVGHSILNQLNMLEQKTLKALQKKEKVTGEQMHTLLENLLPQKTLQERKLNVLNYLVKYDFSMLDRLYDEIDPVNLEHKIVEL